MAWNVIRTPDAAGPLKSYRRLQSANDANQLCRVGAVDWLVLAGLPRELNLAWGRLVLSPFADRESSRLLFPAGFRVFAVGSDMLRRAFS